MSNSTPKLSELFMDATREVIEKGRIKAQMNRLERIMENDRIRLTAVYAEIGKLYVEGTLAKNKGKLEYANKEIKHLKLRLERAEARYEMLEEAHSVDECKEAFRAELTAKIKKAQDSTVIAAYKVKKKAQDVVKGAATTADAITKRTSPIKIKKSKPAETQDITFADLLEELGIEDTDIDTNSEIILSADESAEISAILENLDAELSSLDTEIIEEETAEDGESAESFDFE